MASLANYFISQNQKKIFFSKKGVRFTLTEISFSPIPNRTFVSATNVSDETFRVPIRTFSVRTFFSTPS